MMVMMVVEENKNNACGLIKIKHKEFTNQNIVMDWRKLATSSTIAFETGIQHKVKRNAVYKTVFCKNSV